jgi:hypothetical protein
VNEEKPMIVISRDLARRFRAVAKKCVSGRPRGPAAPVVLQARSGTLTLWTRAGEVELVHTGPASSPSGDETLVVPMAVLQAVEGGSGEPVELAVDRKLRGTARWSDRGISRTTSFDTVLPGRHHRVPDPPGDLARVAPEFLTALYQCGRTAAREATRFALDRVQVRGKAGQVAGTDGRQALLWAGLRLPFADDVLVPATSVFGAPELAGQPDVRVGRTASHLVVAAGPWAVRLPADPGGRYPDVAGIVPRPPSPSVAGIDGRDAAALLAALPGLPGAGDEDRQVTLELDGGVVVRAKDAGAGVVSELYLARSPAAGPGRPRPDGPGPGTDARLPHRPGVAGRQAARGRGGRPDVRGAAPRPVGGRPADLRGGADLDHRAGPARHPHHFREED